MSILIVTLGFDEKFQVRAVMRRFKEINKVIIVGSFNDEKANNALRNLEDIIGKIAGVSYEVLEVNPYSFEDIVVSISKIIHKYEGNKFILNLSGGMRILILGVTFAFFINNINAEIEIETEDFKRLATVNINDFMPISISVDCLNILKAVALGYNTINSISSFLKLPLSTVWRKIKELRSEGLLTENNQLTAKGSLLLKIHENNFS